MIFNNPLFIFQVIRYASHVSIMLASFGPTSGDMRRNNVVSGPIVELHTITTVVESINGTTSTVVQSPEGFHPQPEKLLDDFVKRMSLYFSIGFRCFYLAIPFALFAVGPYALIAATVVCLAALAHMDHPSDFKYN